MAANSVSRTVHLESENKNLLDTVEKLKVKVLTLQTEIQNLKEGRFFFIFNFYYYYDALQ